MLVEAVFALVQRLGRYEVSIAQFGLYYSLDEIRIGVRVGVEKFDYDVVHLAEGDLLNHVVTLRVHCNGVDLGEHSLYSRSRGLLPPRVSSVTMSEDVVLLVIWPLQDQQRTAP